MKEVGAENVVEIQAEAFKEVMESNLAAKQDIKDLRRDMLIIKKGSTQDIIKKDLTVRIGSVLIFAVSILTVLTTLLHRISIKLSVL